MPTLVFALGLVSLGLSSAGQSTDPVIRGRVVDGSGHPVAGAAIRVPSDPDCATSTASDGTFSLDCAGHGSIVRVTAPGFRDLDVPARAMGSDPARRLVLQPTPYAETVVVTATRAEGRTVSRAAPVSALTSIDFELAPAAPLDDLLRSIPGFSLFRRSSSRVSNPTTQGATLRGLSASGASRALVLADGLPLNDPFGGWVGWNRVPVAAIDRVEVVRGGASDLYGADALAGVVQVLTVRPTSPTLRTEVTGGSRGTGRASVFGGAVLGAWEVTLAGEASTTDGYILVPEGERGAIDVAAGGRYTTARGGLGYTGDDWHIRAGGTAFFEDRENGTPLQVNDTSSWQARVDGGGHVRGGRWRMRLHAAEQTYQQAFSAIASSRASETLTLRQRVPASEHGFSAEWSRSLDGLDVLVGGDVRETAATNHEQGFFPDGRLRVPTSTPAFQRTSGLFAQTTVRARDDLTLTLGARGDLRERDRSSGLGDADSKVSPRVSAAWTATPGVVVRASAGWSYRAPTLNERYRGFRVGSVLTLPNADLRSESLRTLEGGVFLLPRHGSLRLTVFRGDLDDGVTNVTLTTTPELITRRRENVGGVRVVGAELEGEWRLTRATTVTAAASILDSRFTDDPVLNDLRVPQVPRWQGSLTALWRAPHDMDLSAHLRIFGRQFEDDRNTLTLDRGATVDLAASRRIGPRFSMVVSIENLTNLRYDVGRTPTRTIGQPIGLYGGLRFEPRR